MRMVVQGWVITVLFLFGAAGSAVEPAHDPALLARVVAAQQGHTTVQGRLRWLTSRLDDPTTPPREQHVRFFLAFPERYALIVTKPGDPEFRHSFISDGKNRWEVMQAFSDEAPEVKASVIGGEDEVERRLLACFRFDLTALQQDFSLHAEPLGDGARVTLTPTTPALKEQLTLLILTFDAAHRLIAIRSEDPQGNRLDFPVVEAVYNEPLDDALFRVAP